MATSSVTAATIADSISASMFPAYKQRRMCIGAQCVTKQPNAQSHKVGTSLFFLFQPTSCACWGLFEGEAARLNPTVDHANPALRSCSPPCDVLSYFPMLLQHPNKVSAPALGSVQIEALKANMENTELYPVHPFRLAGVGKAGLEAAMQTYAERTSVCNTG